MNSNLLEYFRACRFGYLVGMPLISDAEYDVLKDQVAKECPGAKELDQIYEEDSINFESLEAFGIPSYLISSYISRRGIKATFKYTESELLASDDNKSIISYKTEEEIVAKFRAMGEGTYCLSPKIDGIYISLIYERGEFDNLTYTFASGQTRGGQGDAVDVSNIVSVLFPAQLHVKDDSPLVKKDLKSIKISFEAIVKKGDFERLNYVNQKSAAQGILMSLVNIKADSFKYLVFTAHGLSSFDDTPALMYETLTTLGFNTVPYTELCYNEHTIMSDVLPIYYNLFTTWEKNENIEADGIVVKKVEGNTGIAESGSKSYIANTFAMKAHKWNEGVYVSKVVDIQADQKDCDISYRLIIEPVKSKSGKSLHDLTNLRLKTLIDQDIRIGDSVLLSYLNDTTPKFIRKVGSNEGGDTSDN